VNDRPPSGRRVAILGGGMASLAAAWRLSHDDGIGEITVYQRGWRLGGKGASSRGEHDRIEEHGLHVWLGYYDNAFRLVREIYDAIDRPTRDPDCAIATWRDAFAPAPNVGLATPGSDARRGAAAWDEWTALFSMNDQVPGEPLVGDDDLDAVEFVRRSLSLVSDYVRSLEQATPLDRGAITLSANPVPPRHHVDVSSTVERALDVVTAVIHELTRYSIGAAGAVPMLPVALELLESLRTATSRAVGESTPRRRLFELVDVAVTSVRGILVDGLLTDSRGFAAVNAEEYTEWLRRHGIAEETLASPLVHGVYDLVFGYRNGDPGQPQFAAGTAVLLGSKLFWDYRGSIFWKMQAGMGDVVFAPLYQALRERGVRFEFFHQVDDLILSPDGSRIETVRMTRQVELADGRESYEPLCSFGGVPCFPAEPDAAQLAAAPGSPRSLELLWDAEEIDQRCGEATEIRAGADFDVIVYGLSIGMVPHTCRELLQANGAWRDMVANVGTVATQAFQLWLRDDETTLGWQVPGSTITGFVKPFDTIASMSHLVPVEGWPASDRPGSIMYFCNTLPEPPPPGRERVDYPREQLARVRAHAVSFLERDAATFLPGVVRPDGGFDWDQLRGAGDATGEARFDSQFWTANVDPSDRYVQSLPGSDRARIRADRTGFDNVYITGDWTDCGLNAGCIEAAVVSGLQTANALLGDERWAGISGGYRRLLRDA
jgi:uncharacterized protein with NAD-binding domain and iron-sulfur cluster